MARQSRFSKGTKAGVLGSILGIALSLGLLFAPLETSEVCSSNGGCSVVRGPSGIDYILGVNGSDPALFFVSLFILVFALIGGYGAWNGNRVLVRLTAVAFVVLTILGILTIGLFVAPVALLFVLAGIWLQDGHSAESSGRSVPRS